MRFFGYIFGWIGTASELAVDRYRQGRLAGSRRVWSKERDRRERIKREKEKEQEILCREK